MDLGLHNSGGPDDSGANEPAAVAVAVQELGWVLAGNRSGKPAGQTEADEEADSAAAVEGAATDSSTALVLPFVS